ncbi:MAG: DUF4974 domain-containing protein [Prevotellaceae bacterium]|jgi:ferric-dicitrate binding protein FerR (iron transport regulator)|nr:DUF4974 domain-containing protein [Prevotellaceae bacterium]
MPYFKEIPTDIFEKILSGNFSENDISIYLEQHPEHKKVIDELLFLSNQFNKNQFTVSENDAFDKIIEKAGQPQKRHFISHYRYQIISVAALLILFFSLLTFFPAGKNTIGDEAIDKKTIAYLELSDGRKIDLGKEKEVLVDDKGIQINLKGQDIDYNGKTTEEIVVYNTLVVPNKGEYILRLTDGTVVYVNSGSTLEFPLQVPKKGERRVKLKGEAYFDVVESDKDNRFIVETEKGNIEVLGTSFNVSSYSADKYWHATLVSGKIVFTSTDKEYSAELSPSEQIAIDRNNNYNIKVVDAKTYTVWKDGLFKFDNMPLELIVERLQRWYDVAIEFKDSIIAGECFTGVFRKNEPIEHILLMLEKTQKIKVVSNNQQNIILIKYP